jgi:hypothetical protein
MHCVLQKWCWVMGWDSEVWLCVLQVVGEGGGGGLKRRRIDLVANSIRGQVRKSDSFLPGAAVK